MAVTGKSKREAYELLGGAGPYHYLCFLCDFIKQNKFDCQQCIKWPSSDGRCNSSGSKFEIWANDQTTENTQAVADFLYEKYNEMLKEK